MNDAEKRQKQHTHTHQNNIDPLQINEIETELNGFEYVQSDRL